MNDEGVGPVVSAVLLLGLITVVAAIWTANTLPEWVTQNEQSHRDDVAQGLLGLRDDVEAAAIRQTSLPATAALDLAPTPIPLLQPTGAQGRIHLGGTTSASISFSDATIVAASGSLLGPAESPIPQSYASVERLAGLLFSLEAQGTTASKSAWALLEATDGTTTVYANMTHQNGISCSGREVRLTVGVQGESPRFDQAISCGTGNNLAPFEVDLMDSRYKLDGVLDTLDSPFDVTLTKGGQSLADATHAIWWINANGDQISGSGSSGTDLSITRLGQTLVYDLDSRGLIDQELIVDAGGLIVAQQDGQAVLSAPGLTLTGGASAPRLTWTLLLAEGSGDVSGTGPATVTATYEDALDALFTAEDGFLNLTTPYASAWAEYIQHRLDVAGMAGNATVAASGDQLSFALAAGNWTVRLHVITASWEVR